MAERASSNTAWGVMVLRAAHQLIDDLPRLLDDPVAVQLIDADTRARILEPGGRIHTPGARTLRAHVLLRSRYAEDQLAHAVARGVTQLIVLGAGYDTFAWRQPEWAAALRIFEVDHPASQRAKRDRLREVGIVEPANLLFAPIDFETTTLHDGLVAAGFDPAQRTFISCLGVLMYLTEAAVDTIFRFARTFPSGSEMVCTFKSARDGEAPGDSPLAKAAASVGEPWLSQFDPWQLQQKLQAMGFADVTMVSGAQIEVRYALHRRDGVQPSRNMMIADIRN